ncbi:hypothetical protein [Bacillus sp. B-jedd]|uniref:hypothetical protein n=1 Tax=Bacillus sp. B-jedd TaxID=1476857 RepID=UPI0005155D9E|nr:hypothetical protein [Bacillus sp. B-jedd]CEG27227.1 hypothetical protein BN1002_02083 [Bacillus sp. B-jedd]
MDKFTKEELEDALLIVSSTINKCEKIQPKFAEGTSQYSLLTNRIKALVIAKLLLIGEKVDNYSDEELTEALRPLTSIINKCTKAQLKHSEGSPHHNKHQNIIKAMSISKSFIANEIATWDK